MNNALKRNFEKGQYVYVIDYWGTINGTQAFETQAKIWDVNNKEKTFTAVLYGDTFQTYSFNDYKRLIFDTSHEANKAVNQFPKPQTIVYHVIGNRVYKKVVLEIYGKNNGTYDLVIRLNKGKDISSKEINHSLFLSETDARNSKKK